MLNIVNCAITSTENWAAGRQRHRARFGVLALFNVRDVCLHESSRDPDHD
jgi:hypothetical protein